jgi:hypothetical protein
MRLAAGLTDLDQAAAGSPAFVFAISRLKRKQAPQIEIASLLTHRSI